MATLQDALSNTGLVSKKQVEETKAEQQLRLEATASKDARPMKEKEKRLGILNETSSVDTFRREARKLLLAQPEHRLVLEILNIAHAQRMHERKKQGGGRLIANLYQVRDALAKNVSESECHALVNKLLPKT